MFKRTVFRSLLAASAGLMIAASAAAATSAPQPLKLEVYNPGANGIFPVSSELITGNTDAIVIDAQFDRASAEQLLKKVQDSGKKLTTIYISHGDPDYYFGLEVLKAAYPEAKIVAPAPVVAHIKATMEGKLAFWGPKLGANAPKQLIVPEALEGNTLTLEGRKLEVIGLDGASPDRSFVWIPSLKAVVGGVLVVGNEHVWTADTQTLASRQQWIKMLDKISALHPKVVVPGHFSAGAPQNIESVRFTKDYLKTYEAETVKAKDSAALIEAMKKHYPNLDGVSSLELGAKVSKGEMKW
ncbi:glyoxylase-like metal-dependent hydrolase (beta-lactamase superfamily II) [Collimonas sp. PA-H2]|uniref:MBL fold metallo-hydrolase n=1 Tax=Collimonas sp. PA-H2 TaxID=1881062 RepID=UPI000BF331B6|nr:MBL fold metallo-hydrolase [Collimonas sp. PA-H2]PFH11105.1 glyoxylase-like metal-dependent hydrolase (beta-lactamase superfamily II) [Collimonas sp. PA-H2]